MSYTVSAHCMGTMPLPGPEVFWMQAWDEWFDAHFWMLVARSPEATVVINTGPPRELEPLNAMWRRSHPSGNKWYRRSEAQHPEAALASIGVDPSSVTHVVFTPLVTYTLGGIELFPNAELCFSRRGWIEDVLAPPLPHHLPREIFVPDEALHHLLFAARDRVRLLQDGDHVAPGMRVWEAGVHHRSSLAVEIETDRGRVVATDAAFSYRNVEQNIALGIGESYEEAMRTYARLRAEADVLVPLYEPALAVRHPDGRIA